MSLNLLVEAPYRVFRQQLADARIVLLHPRSRFRSLLVAHLINSPDYTVFYYALGPDDTSIASFISGITHDLANQHPTFGRHVHMLTDPLSDLDALLDTFARDLAELHSEPFLLVLDEYDRSDGADDIQMFIERLVKKLPEHCKIVINSRTLPRLPWVSMIAQHHAAILFDDQLITEDFYSIRSDGSQRLQVYALGPGVVLLNDEPIDNWEGHLPRLLFFFALDRPVITRSEICQAFWPDLDIDQAVNVFHVTKRRLHKALNMDVLVHDNGYYRVNPELDVHYDVMEFVTLLVHARDAEAKNRMALWQRATEIYRGPFLQGHNDLWIERRRVDFRAGYLEALTQMAHVRLAEGRQELALGLLQKALMEDVTREDLHREVMRLFTSMGRRSEAAAHYQRLSEDLRKIKLKVSDETEALYAEIMA